MCPLICRCDSLLSAHRPVDEARDKPLDQRGLRCVTLRWIISFSSSTMSNLNVFVKFFFKAVCQRTLQRSSQTVIVLYLNSLWNVNGVGCIWCLLTLLSDLPHSSASYLPHKIHSTVKKKKKLLCFLTQWHPQHLSIVMFTKAHVPNNCRHPLTLNIVTPWSSSNVATIFGRLEDNPRRLNCVSRRWSAGRQNLLKRIAIPTKKSTPAKMSPPFRIK